jgi:uncharacterized SAM-binding protein YcdF (DUF218 family)
MIINVIKFLLDPFNILWILILITGTAYLLKRVNLCRWFMALTGTYFLVISTPFIPVILVNTLEDRFEPVYIEDLDNTDGEYHIIVLGGGHGFDDRLPANSLLSSRALGRLNEGIRLHNQLPNSKLVLSGYSSSGRTTQAEMLQNTAILLGVNRDATIIQTEPENTYREAEVYSGNFGNRYPVILVTSATHMPRAVMVFEHFGVDVIPSPTNYRLKGSWKRVRFGWPDVSNIDHLGAGMSEYAAILREKFSRGER